MIRAVAADAASRLARDVDADRARDVFASGTLLDGVLANHTARACRVVCAPKSSAAIRAFRDDIAPTSSRFFPASLRVVGVLGTRRIRPAANEAVDFIARASMRGFGRRRRAIRTVVRRRDGDASRGDDASISGDGHRRRRPASGARSRACFARAVVCVAAFDLKALALSARHLHRAFGRTRRRRHRSIASRCLRSRDAAASNRRASRRRRRRRPRRRSTTSRRRRRPSSRARWERRSTTTRRSCNTDWTV